MRAEGGLRMQTPLPARLPFLTLATDYGQGLVSLNRRSDKSCMSPSRMAVSRLWRPKSQKRIWKTSQMGLQNYWPKTTTLVELSHLRRGEGPRWNGSAQPDVLRILRL